MVQAGSTASHTLRAAFGVMFGSAIALSACGGPLEEDDGLNVVQSSFRVRADPPGDMFAGPVTVTLHAEQPGTVYYTTDGSSPSEDGLVYDGPVRIEDNTLLTFIAVNDDGVWSEPNTELYEVRGVVIAPSQAQRMLNLSDSHVYFSARPGDDLLERRLTISSMGRNPVLIQSMYLGASRETGNFFENGVFRIENPIPDNTLLLPGESRQIVLTYRATDTLRTAALVFETDDPREEDGILQVQLSGRIFNW